MELVGEFSEEGDFGERRYGLNEEEGWIEEYEIFQNYSNFQLVEKWG